MTNPAVLTEQQAALYIGMSSRWLRQIRSTGTLFDQTPAPPHLKLGRSVRYRVKDLDTWLEERKAS